MLRTTKRRIKEFGNWLLAPTGFQLKSKLSPTRSFQESFAVAKDFIEQPATIIDIGVADGTPDLYQAFPFDRHDYLLIEANDAFQAALAAFEKHPRVKVARCLCGAENGTATFYNGGDNYKASLLPRAGAKMAEVTLPMQTLDSLVATHQLKGPFVVKIDVEGAEVAVLRGAVETLKHAVLVIAETPIQVKKEAASNFGDIVSFMNEHNFALFDIAEASYHPKTGVLNLANALFVKREKLIRKKK